MSEIEMFQRFATAIAIGAIVGSERHWRECDQAGGSRTAGLRTFTLIGMLGGVAGLLVRAGGEASVAGAIVFAALFSTQAVIFALYQRREAEAQGNFSVTTTIAAMLTFVLVTVAVVGDLTVASAGGVVLVAILASREVLHGFMRRLTWMELRSAIVLLAMTFVILPLVPDEPIGPFGGISPFKTWLLVVILAAVSFCGYVAVSLLGSARGEFVAGLVGGLASSTGVTLTNARRSSEGESARMLAAGALAACAVSYVRTAALVVALAPSVSRNLLPPLLVAALAMTICAWMLSRGSAQEHPEQKPKNPFDLDSVLKMALLLVGIGFLARAAAHWLGDRGLILVSGLSGLADVDAAVVTVAGMLADLAPGVAEFAIGMAVVANTLAKAAYALAFGVAAFGVRFLLSTAVTLIFALATYWAILLYPAG